MVKIGIIGGSGLDNPNILENPKETEVETPYGMPSSRLTEGRIKGVDVVLIARHGKKHQYPPTNVNYRANIWALKKAGCTHILATTAVGSLREEIGRGDLVLPDQFIDFTRHRIITFHESFENGAVHTPMAEPFSKELRHILIETCKELHIKHHEKGTVITIESTKILNKGRKQDVQAVGR